MTTKKLEQSIVGKILRWILFIPAGYICMSILYVIPVYIITAAMGYKPEFNFFTLILGILAVSILTPLTFWWIGMILLMPRLVCNVIAPNHKVASIIFGTVICLEQLKNLPGLFQTGWASITYQLVFFILTLSGIVWAYLQEDL